MGGWISYMSTSCDGSGSGGSDEVNQMTGLTKQEVAAVQKSWALVFANKVPNGAELFKRLFCAYPETKDFFKMLKNTPEEEFPNNSQFKAHVINLMTSLNTAVTNLNKPETVAEQMNKIGESHKKRNIKERHFLDLKIVIVQMFTEVLKLDKATLGAWDKTVDFLYKHIFKTLNASEKRC